jgi:hypothetical protein
MLNMAAPADGIFATLRSYALCVLPVRRTLVKLNASTEITLFELQAQQMSVSRSLMAQERRVYYRRRMHPVEDTTSHPNLRVAETLRFHLLRIVQTPNVTSFHT